MKPKSAAIAARISALCRDRSCRAFAAPRPTIRSSCLTKSTRLGRDFRGDPGSALLEALDPEQNFSFRDNYLDVPFDLSKVLFITTANMLDPVAEPLRDRMEIIELQGYTEEEKVHIAFQYLIPRQIEENGINGDQIEFPEETIGFIIRHYTREAGVRNLERTIGTICRKQARRIAEGKTDKLRGDARTGAAASTCWAA